MGPATSAATAWRGWAKAEKDDLVVRVGEREREREQQQKREEAGIFRGYVLLTAVADRTLR
eukprot:5892800-Pyramimonas_sp.AAC.1